VETEDEVVAGLWPAPPCAGNISMPLTKEQVTWAYRMLLGREPESTASVDRQIKAHADVNALREGFFGSPEFFRNRYRALIRAFAKQETERVYSEIESACSPSEMRLLFNHIASVWSKLGVEEPHFSVLSHLHFKPDNIDVSISEFERTGRGEASLLFTELSGLGLADRFGHIVELGCGVGRVTRYLSERAATVTGYDVSEPHLNLARGYLAREGVRNVTFEHVTDPGALELQHCDLFYSRIVLQHNPPPVMLMLVRKALAALVPGGIAVFQCPTYIRGYSFNVGEYLSKMGGIDNQELHALPQKEIFNAIADAGCDVINCYRDNSISNPQSVSNRFVVQKRGH
jgi:SAM-dependent methyltransferase